MLQIKKPQHALQLRLFNAWSFVKFKAMIKHKVIQSKSCYF